MKGFVSLVLVANQIWSFDIHFVSWVAAKLGSISLFFLSVVIIVEVL